MSGFAKLSEDDLSLLLLHLLCSLFQ